MSIEFCVPNTVIDCLVIHMLLDVLMPNFCGLWLLVLLNVHTFSSFTLCWLFLVVLVLFPFLFISVHCSWSRVAKSVADDVPPPPPLHIGPFTQTSLLSKFQNHEDLQLSNICWGSLEYESPVACYSRNLPHKCCDDD